MTEKKGAAEQPAMQAESKIKDAASILVASVEKEKAREDTDRDLVESLESTILRVDAPDGAWDKALAAIKKLASSRAESRMEAL